MKKMYLKCLSTFTMTMTLFIGSIAFAASPGDGISGNSVSGNEMEIIELYNTNDNAPGARTVSLEEEVLPKAGVEAALNEGMDEIVPGSEPTTYWGYTNLGLAVVENHLNVRAYPGEDGRLVGKMSNYAACEVLEVADGWAHIISGEIEGYVSTDYLLIGPAAVARASSIVTPIATVTTDSLKVREQPNTDCPVITMVPEGEELEAKEEMGDWVRIDLDGEDAYVSAEYVEVEEKLMTAITMSELLYGEGVSDVRVDLCEYAKQFVGNPYVWGGTSLNNGADCSGFVLSIFAHYGITLPHSAAGQSHYGTEVSASELRPGDLVFYAKGGRINHVAIYIGNGQVLHASSPSTGIRISSMYYRTPAKMVSLLQY